ncbi:sensor histidine kinase [Macrococcoides canis]|uniref:sensor histidine kinase n=1 Tax=Macrococcoides canis TaxID=1855823 RepID=UPI0020B7D66B|nr:sensor histidine kinase [Macrococcus canis]UTH02796.1 sensor histidine kinase [Macrococcus canis]
MSFLKTIQREIYIIVLICALFFFILFMYNVPFQAYLIGLGIVLFISIIYWIIRFINYRQEQTLQELNEELKIENHRLRNDFINYQSEVESYFLMWVHQIKTPITASKLLLEDPDEKVISKVRNEVLQIDNYTNLALNYLKLMNQKTDMVFMEVSIDELVRPLIKRYAIQFIHHQTKLHYDKSNAIVLTDAKWVSIMIEQLLNNALKYARGKDVWITFNDDSKTLSIRDNGIGINASDLPKIFDKGFSGYNGRLSEKSSGIGLYIVNTISKRLGHKVNVNSTINEGSTFTIQFK